MDSHLKGLTYDLAGNLKTETGPIANPQVTAVQTITTEYDQLNRPIKQSDVIGLISETTYDADSNILTTTDGRGHVTVHTYNDLHQRITTTEPLNDGQTRNLSFTYTHFGELLTETGPNGTITHTVDQLGRRRTSTGPDEYNMVYTYDLNGNLTDQTDSRGITTSHIINELDQITSTTRGGYTQSFTHDTVGNLLTETDRRGILTEHTYDMENRLTETTRAGVRQVTTTYNKAGLPVIIKDGNGHNTVHEYNDRYHKTRTIRPENLITSYTPNAYGDVTHQNNPGPNDITRTFDERRRLISETNGANETTTYEYDLNNNRTAVIKPEGQRWEYDFDHANRLITVRNVPEAIETHYTYDAANNLKTITDAEQKTTTLGYDDRNRKTSKTYHDTQVVGYGYDKNGNLASTTLPNGVNITYGHDDLDRQTSQTYSGSHGDATVTFTLDGNGNIEQVDETIDGQTHTTTMAYDDWDRLSMITDRHGYSLQFSHDDNGNRTVLNDQQNGISTYTYDKLNRLAQMVVAGVGTFDYSYNSAGLMSGTTYPNQGESIFTYDDANRIDVITHKQMGVDVASYDQDYDQNGNRTSLAQNNTNNAETITYDYDDADRLTQVIYPDRTVDYLLDKAGNRETETTDDGNTTITRTYGYNTRDQLTSLTDTQGLNITYGYDAAGNQTQKDENGITTTFDYSPRNRINRITHNGIVTEYQYDHLGNRVSKESNNQRTLFSYDGTSLLFETNTIGNTIAKYHYGSDRILAETRSNQNQFIFHDALRTPIAITNEDGSIQNRKDYDAWGEATDETATDNHRFGFTGYQHDEDTGLYYAKARFYDPSIGRFLREDPFQGDVNSPITYHRYLYGNANPSVFVDPNGELGIFLDGTWNNQFNPDEALYQTHTNVKKLSDLYDGKSIYLKGVGTDWYTSTVGGLTGWGVQNRIDDSYRAIVKVLNENKHLRNTDPEAWAELSSLDFFGFSRGSTAAIALTNKIIDEGIPNLDSQFYDFHDRQYKYKDSIDVNIRFLGVFDTVAAIGNPFDGINGLNLTVNTKKVAQTSHAVMVNENRFAFDLIGLDDLENPRFSNIKQRVFLGAHSDGGGGYGRHIKNWHFRMNEWRLSNGLSVPYPEITKEALWRKDQGKPDHMANLTLAWMYSEGVRAGAPFKPLTGLDGLIPDIANMTVDEIEREFVHDSSANWKLYPIEWLINRSDRTVHYPFKDEYFEKERTYEYEQLINLFNNNKELILKEASSVSGVKAK